MKVVLLGNYSVYPFRQELDINTIRRITTWNETLAASLAALPGTEIYVISAISGRQTLRVQREQLRVIYLGERKIVRAITFKFVDALRARKIIKEIKPDIVHGIGTEHIWSTAALLSGYPSVVTIHGVMAKIVPQLAAPPWSSRYWLSRWFAFLEKRVLRRNKYLISINPYIYNTVSELTEAKIYSIENPVAPLFFDAIAHPEQSRNILFVGDTTPLKSLLTLLQAFVLLRQNQKLEGWTIIAVGPQREGAYQDRIMAYIREQRLDSQVRFAGFILPERLVEEYRDAALLVLASRQETAPMCIAEAMTVGLPVVATRVGGVPYMVSDGETGFLCSVDNPEEMAEKLEVLIAHPELRAQMGEQARLAAQDRWHPTRIARQTLDVYNEILGDSG